MPNQVPEKVKKSRLERAMLLQQKISAENNKKWIGRKLKVLIEERSAENAGIWLARSFQDAPDVDANVLVKTRKVLEPGSFQTVTITHSEAYDLVGEL